jgi:hypothetical protein
MIGPAQPATMIRRALARRRRPPACRPPDHGRGDPANGGGVGVRFRPGRFDAGRGVARHRLGARAFSNASANRPSAAQAASPFFGGASAPRAMRPSRSRLRPHAAVEPAETGAWTAPVTVSSADPRRRAPRSRLHRPRRAVPRRPARPRPAAVRPCRPTRSRPASTDRRPPCSPASTPTCPALVDRPGHRAGLRPCAPAASP